MLEAPALNNILSVQLLILAVGLQAFNAARVVRYGMDARPASQHVFMPLALWAGALALRDNGFIFNARWVEMKNRDTDEEPGGEEREEEPGHPTFATRR